MPSKKAAGPARALRIGYVPVSANLQGPGDRRRFVYYARSRNLQFEIADPDKSYDVVVVTQMADLSVWSRYYRGKIIYDAIDSYLVIPKTNVKGILRGLAKYLAGRSRYLQLNYWRAICYQRPYLLLQNTVYEDFKPEWVELYFKRCAAYGVFPSFFSHNAADDPYWRRPNLYDRDRPLFKQWIPVISALSAAGWEPVTHARSDDPKVYVERFGKPSGPLYLTVFNDSQEPRTAKLTKRASGLRSNCLIARSLATISAPAPSLVWLLLPAVTLPLAANAGFSLARPSSEVSGRAPSSRFTVRVFVPVSPVARFGNRSTTSTGVISSVNSPAAIAFSASRSGPSWSGFAR